MLSARGIFHTASVPNY